VGKSEELGFRSQKFDVLELTPPFTLGKKLEGVCKRRSVCESNLQAAYATYLFYLSWLPLDHTTGILGRDTCRRFAGFPYRLSGLGNSRRAANHMLGGFFFGIQSSLVDCLHNARTRRGDNYQHF
jgi:hypothetical protein